MRSASVLGLVALVATPAIAAPSVYDVELIGQFAAACTTPRTSFADNKSAVEAAGWTVAPPEADPELGAIIGFSNQAAADIKSNNGSFDFAVYAKPIAGAEHYLILSDALIGYGPQRETILGCYLYNFDAVAPPDPEAVEALLGVPPTQSQIDMHVSSWQWNRPASLPNVMDVYLTFVPEVSQYKQQYGFSGLVLQLNTAIPNPTAIPGTEGSGG